MVLSPTLITGFVSLHHPFRIDRVLNLSRQDEGYNTASFRSTLHLSLLTTHERTVILSFLVINNLLNWIGCSIKVSVSRLFNSKKKLANPTGGVGRSLYTTSQGVWAPSLLMLIPLSFAVNPKKIQQNHASRVGSFKHMNFIQHILSFGLCKGF